MYEAPPMPGTASGELILPSQVLVSRDPARQAAVRVELPRPLAKNHTFRRVTLCSSKICIDTMQREF